jgi:hypothetical protein
LLAQETFDANEEVKSVERVGLQCINDDNVVLPFDEELELGGQYQGESRQRDIPEDLRREVRLGRVAFKDFGHQIRHNDAAFDDRLL